MNFGPPELSFAVRHLNAAAGIVITATTIQSSITATRHTGRTADCSAEASEAVLKEINTITDITSIKPADEKEALGKGLIRMIGKDVDDVYIENLKTLLVNPDEIKKAADSMKIVYTPLHGSGTKPVRRILDEAGFKNVLVVREQEHPDPEFSTVKSPNPEEKDAFRLGIKLAQEEDVDLVIGTDPDSDRVGVVVRNSAGEYVMLTGNQTGCLLMEYILSQKKAAGSLPENGFVVKTIVTSELARQIAENCGVELIEVLTGFKFIGEKIKELDEPGIKKFIFGFEESYGYLAGTFARDKDAVVASMLICEMAAYYRNRGMSLYDGLQEIFEKYGYFIEGITSFTLEGKEGLEKICAAMDTLRDMNAYSFDGCEITAVRDYLAGIRTDMEDGSSKELGLPVSNVLYYELKDGAWFCVRPSGTEPKIKIYYGVSEKTRKKAKRRLEIIENSVTGMITKLLDLN